MNKDGTMWDDFEFHLADVQGVTDGLYSVSDVKDIWSLAESLEGSC